MEQLSEERLLELNHLTKQEADKMSLRVKCKFCGESMIRHTQNDAWWHLIYVSQDMTYEQIYGTKLQD